MRIRLGWVLLATLLLLPGASCGDDADGRGPGGIGGDTTLDPGSVDEGGTPDALAPDSGGTDAAPDPGGPELPPVEDIEQPAVLSIISVSPNVGESTGLEQVEIFGTGFTSATMVFFGESAASDVFVLNDTRLACLTPPRQPGLVDVRLVDSSLEQSAILEAGYLYFNKVTLVAVDPPAGHVMGGDPITIIGTGFVPGTKVLIGELSAISVEVVDDTTILAVTPAAPNPGPVNVHVSNPQGIATLEDGFLYYDSPDVHSVSPPVGLVGGGNTVDIMGGGFVEPLAVSFAGKALKDVEVITSERIRGGVPAADGPGAVDVMVSTTYGAAVARGAYVYVESVEPTDQVSILAVTPPKGPAAGETLVDVVATGLTSTEDTTITFGGREALVKGADPDSMRAIVEVPAGDVGAVDVTLTNANGSDTAAGAYTYEPFVRVYEVLPNFGPTAGGTAIHIDGIGFEEGATVRVGALPASNVFVESDSTITAVTPPGSPGLANVTVTQFGVTDTLVGGFAYQAPMELWVVDPPQGSQAGGTQISLLGAGFPTDARVLVGGVPATHVKVISPTLVQAKTPPGSIGTVDVTLTSELKGDVTLPLSFTYYNPESTFGGTWGQEVRGDVNVTVLSGADGSPIPDAFVMLWTDPKTPYQGYTNQLGQITFSGPDLLGEQMVSASKAGFASVSVIEYDATNITVYMTPTTPSQGGPPPGITPPVFRGQVVNATKYVPVPWGTCAEKTDAPGLLCQPCTTDEDCGMLTCSELPNQGSYCTQHCVNTDDCADGFMCVPLNGVDNPQCVPATGYVTAFCDFTKPTIFSEDYLPPPGIQVESDFSFEMPLPLGETAVFCWGGIASDTGLYCTTDDECLASNEFCSTDTSTCHELTPYALGLARHVFGQPGDVIDRDVVLSHRLAYEMNARLDDPPDNPLGPDFNYMFLHLDLGGDGTLEFLEHPFSFGDSPLVVEHAPKSLTGDLYDASYTILAGAFSFTDNNMPYSLTLHYDVTKVEDDTMYYFEGDGWEDKATGVTQNINGLWSSGPDQMVGVGSDGLIIRAFGGAWASQPSGTTQHLRGVHELPTGEAVAVGNGGTILHYDGNAWTPAISGTSSNFEAVWMFAPDDVIAVGWYQVHHFDGAGWSSMSGSVSKNLRGVWGAAPDDAWAVGLYGQVIRYDGATWTDQYSGTTQGFHGVWGSGPDDVFIVGELGSIMHWDGVELMPMDSGVDVTLESVWGTGPNEVYAVGARGTILRYDGAQWTNESPKTYNSTFLALAGNDGRIVATGTHELLLGPMLEVPENIDPGDGDVMGEDYTIDWTVLPGPDPHFNYVEVAVPGMTGPVPEWTMVADYYVTDILLPDFPNIEGTPGISPGTKYLTIIRAYREGFDINNYTYNDLGTSNWRSWAMDQVIFTKN